MKGSHKGLHGFTHPRAALEKASGLFELNRLERDIIVKHMWPLTLRFPRYRESYVVNLSDKLCAMAELLHIYHKARMRTKLADVWWAARPFSMPPHAKLAACFFCFMNTHPRFISLLRLRLRRL